LSAELTKTHSFRLLNHACTVVYTPDVFALIIMLFFVFPCCWSIDVFFVFMVNAIQPLGLFVYKGTQSFMTTSNYSMSHLKKK